MQRSRLRGDLPRDGGLPGHHPAARSAAARVPAQGAAPRSRRWRGELKIAVGRAAGRHRPAARGEPDARPSRLPARHHLSRDHRDAGARHLRGRLHGGGAEGPGHAGGHDPAHRERGGVPEAGADRAAGGGGGVPRAADHGAVPARHHDRAAPRRAHRRRARPRGAVLLLRHQRSHPDHLGPVAATTPGTSCPTTSSTASSRTIRSRCSTRPASAS